MKLYRPATILVGLLFVLLAGVARLAEPDTVYGNDSNLKVVSGTIGQVLPWTGSGSTFKVTRVKFAQKLLSGRASDTDKPIETNGIFIAIEWDSVRGVANPESFTPTLTTDSGSVYAEVSDPSESDISFPDAGFARTGAAVFEANPADLKGLTLRLKPQMIFTVYNSEIRVDLGIPTDSIAQQLVDSAEEQYIVQPAVTRVAS
ncbi:hypothetical protein [Kribbella sp.]|uniref:hypothetical protein n=1 Tax=Kribbella sp. TaxID=1871183 RepID=UPI002D6D10FD|nr:hypothetical protein [Kribbella sp.]HZX03127.1 hypothetical protein [Kribbella sp.]